MGVVYAAQDERLQRTVAIKILRSLQQDEAARQRFWREARAAASVNHPNVCQIHDVGEDSGTLFLAMELLEGESLAERLARGPLPVGDAVPIALQILAALAALHGRGLVHRDLKPANVFLTPHGVKLLDFGLARPELESAVASAGSLTRSGVIMGTPRYMAPEQALGEHVDGRSDLFAAGAILFEMLAGRPAFAGSTVMAVLHATLHEQPPALTGSPAVVAVDRVIRRALSKRPGDRFPSAEAFADELRELPRGESGDTRAMAQPLTRIVVLPFQVLRQDPEVDFLAFSLPDAIATSLSSVRSLVVRSTATAARFAGQAPDLKALAAEADVDRAVTGTVLRVGQQVRANVQVLETPGGTVLAAHTIDAGLHDLFRLQDDIARRVGEALALPSNGAVAAAPEGEPNPRAYEFYLRGNEMARTYTGLPRARELYLRAIELDPRFAPAWAQLGRCHRVIGKYLVGTPDSEDQAQAALDRALAIDPRLSIAHKFAASLDADLGAAQRGVVRLLREAALHGNDPELFAGLVQACRYCGLYDEALAAHAEARRLDPNVQTSLDQTLLTAAQFDRLLAQDRPPLDGGADEGIRIMGLGLVGRREEARQALLVMRDAMRVPAFQTWADYLMAWLERRPDDMRLRYAGLDGLKITVDPEAIFLQGWLLSDAGVLDEALLYLERAVAKGYYAAPTLATSRHFDPLRSDRRFRDALAAATAGRQRALDAFRAAGGERLLALGASA